jgi:presequence protease
MVLLKKRWFSSSSEAFKKLRQIRVDELSLEVSEFEHLKTGALFYHLDHSSADTFSIAFRTLPTDSTGLPHILEHTALCGSQSFPVRDPFFKMLNRSLAVYMNAWTGADFTQYPFVTENSADYDNLRRIYLDAVFRPLLLKDDFSQEGWRLVPSAGQREADIGGVVYNEMKGALSDADSFFLTRFQQARFGPDSVYGVVSGGDPSEIPKLIHQDLVNFHRKFYHPSNSITVSSGKQPIEDNLKALQDYLSKFDRSEVDLRRLTVKQQLKSPQRLEITGPIDPLGDSKSQTRLLVSFLANDTANVSESFALKIICELLFEGPASPFYRALIDSGLGSEYAPGTGYDTSTYQSTICVGLQGLDEDKLKKVEEVIDETFIKVRANPEDFISKERVETVLHQLELGLRYSSANFGLSLVSAVTQSWIHGADPISAVSISNKVTEFRKKYELGGLFEGLLDKYILNNQQSRLCFIMRPDPKHADKLEAKEREFVSKQEIDIEVLKGDALRLKEKQESEQNLSCLPCLALDQVSHEIRDKALKPKSESNLKYKLYERKSSEANGLIYFKAGLKLGRNLSDRQILLLPMLLQCFSELGGSFRNSAADFDSTIKRFTGGLGFSIQQGHLKYPSLSSDMSLLVSSYGLTVNGGKMVELLKEALTDCNLLGDKERIKMLISASAASMSSSIASSGNKYAALKAASAFNSERFKISEALSGLTQGHFLNKLTEEPIEKVTNELIELRDQILSDSSDFKAALIHSEADETFTNKIDNFFTTLKTETETLLKDSSFSQMSNSEKSLFIPGPFSSNFTAMALMPFKEKSPSSSQSAFLAICAKLLRSKYLHREIREKGGAYGSAASFSSISGLFTFSSYRDPSPFNSLKVFKSSGKALLSRDCPSEEDLLGAKLSVFSDLDSPVDVSSRGLQEFFHGPEIGSDDRRQEYRDALRSCTLKNVKETIETVLLPLIESTEDGRVCVIGEEGKLKEIENDEKIIKWKIQE